MFLSYDYEELLIELVDDLMSIGADEDDTIYIVRGEEKFGYKPITDYYLREKHILDDDKDKVEKKKVRDVVKEMYNMNKIIK